MTEAPSAASAEHRQQMFAMARDETAARCRYWSWTGDGQWRYSRPGCGWYARVDVTGGAFGWSIRSKQDSAELASGSDEGIGAMFRHVTRYEDRGTATVTTVKLAEADPERIPL